MTTAVLRSWARGAADTSETDASGVTPPNPTTTYEVDYLNGDDANTGAPGWPWKHDPEMSNATGNAASATLSSGDTIQYVSGHWKLPAGTAIEPTVSGVTRKTVPGAASNVVLDYCQYSTDAWEDTGGNVWRYTVGGTAQPGRAWVNGTALNTVWALEDLTEDRPWYDGDATYAYVYSTQDPWDRWGDSLCWNRYSGENNGIVVAEDTADDLTFEDIDIWGAEHGAFVNSGNNYCTLDNVNVYRWYTHGIKFAGWGTTPIRFPTVTNCTVDMVTQIDEFPMVGERANSDGIAFQGAVVGGSITYCHVQDNHHSAYMVNAYSFSGSEFGCIACEVGYCTADNRNSFYGRGIGSVGGLADTYHNAYNIFHHNEFTNMQTRSQISGDYIRVYNNKFCNTTGSLVTGATVVANPIRGQGLLMASYPDNGFGLQGPTNCEVFNNTFVDNQLEGLRVQCGNDSQHGPNTFRDNVFLNNNRTADPEETDVVDAQVLLNYAPTPTNEDVFTDNFFALRGGSASDDVIMRRESGSYFGYTVAELNGFGTSSGNSADVDSLKVTPDGVPVTGSAVKSHGTLPAIPATNILTDGNDLLGVTDNWGNGPSTTRDKFGFEAAAVNAQVYVRPPDTTYPADLTFSCLIGTRPGTVFLDTDPDNFWLRTNDGSSVVNGTTQKVERETLGLTELTRNFDGASTANWGYIQARLSIDYTTPAGFEVSHVRLAEEDSATPPRWDEYDRLDFNGNDQGAAYVGADATITTPTVPNLVQDAFGVRRTEAEATALLTANFLAAGTITYITHGGVPSGEVISQATASGSTAAVDDTVDFVVSA